MRSKRQSTVPQAPRHTVFTRSQQQATPASAGRRGHSHHPPAAAARPPSPLLSRAPVPSRACAPAAAAPATPPAPRWSSPPARPRRSPPAYATAAAGRHAQLARDLGERTPTRPHELDRLTPKLRRIRFLMIDRSRHAMDTDPSRLTGQHRPSAQVSTKTGHSTEPA
jgi:hypothetical protein